MKLIEQIYVTGFPLKWAYLEYYPDSKGERKEIMLTGERDRVEGLVILFFTLFGSLKENIRIYSDAWWDFCLDTWNPKKDEYDYEPEEKSTETGAYLQMLKDADLPADYSGSCTCLDWERFLLITLRCIVSHQAPYSPVFYSQKDNFFFYFHHSGSIGFYYEHNNAVVTKIINTAMEEYEMK